MVQKVIVALTGASGITYGLSLVKYLLEKGYSVAVIYSDSAKEVARTECEKELDELFSEYRRKYTENLLVFGEKDYNAPFASTSNIWDAMVVVPCSIKTLSLIANGIAENLIVRASLNMLRMKKPLVLVPRETPLGVIELESMLRVAQAGAIVLPAMPAFYHKPKTIQDMVNFIVGKILDVLGIEHSLYERWRDTGK